MQRKNRWSGFVLLAFFSATQAWALPQPVGIYWKGRLKNAANAHQAILQNAEFVETVSPEPFQYSTDLLLNTVLDLSRWAHQTFTGYKLQIGDMSKKYGGRIAAHETHQNGLDADIGYISKAPKLEGHRARKWHNKFREIFVKRGKVSPSFDLARNYALLKYIVAHYPVSHIFVGCKLKLALLAFHPENEPPAERQKLFALLISYPYHDDHFHLRLKCPEGSKRCRPDPRDWRDVDCADAKKDL